MSVPIREARLDDLEAIFAVEESVFGSDAWSRDGLRGELTAPHRHYLVVESAAGTGVDAYAGILSARGSSEADVQTVAVAAHVRRRGLARALLDALFAEALRRGARDVFLEVRADNPGARRLYDRLGFVELGLRRRYYKPDGVDAIVMRKRLETATGLAGVVGSRAEPGGVPHGEGAS